MTSRSKIVTAVIVGLIVVLGAGGPIYYFTVHEPAERARARRDQVARWGAAWSEMKTCLYGGFERRGSIEDTLLLHELRDGADAFDPCREKMDALLGFRESSTGVPELDVAWRELEVWARQLEKGFQGVHGGTETAGPESTIGALASERASGHGPEERAHEIRFDEPAEQRRRLAEKIRDLEEHYAALRSAAGMEPAAAPTPVPLAPALPAGTVVAASEGEMFVLERTASAMSIRADQGDHDRIVVVRGPDSIERYPVRRGVVRALSGNWGAFAGERDAVLRAAELDESGAPSGEGVLVFRSPSSDALQPRLAVGTGDHRAIVYDAGYWSYLAASGDGGASWKRQWKFRDLWFAASWSLGIAHGFHSSRGVTRWVPITADNPGRLRLKLRRSSGGGGSRPITCFAPSYLWVIGPQEILRADHGGESRPTRMSWPPPGRFWMLRDAHLCGDEQLVYAEPDGRQARLTICTVGETCRQHRFEFEPVENAGYPMFTLALGDGGVHAANVLGDALVIWRPDDQSRLTPVAVYALAPQESVQGLLDTDAGLHALIFDGAKSELSLVPVPDNDVLDD